MKTIMIDRTIKNIKKNFNTLEGILTAIISGKKIRYKVLEGILTAKIAKLKKNFFLSFLYIKRLNIKHESNIS